MVPVSSNTTAQFPSVATRSSRRYHCRLAVPDVGTFHFALFESEDLRHHRLCLGHTFWGAIIASPDGVGMRNRGLTTPLTVWLDRLVDLPMACPVECSTGFVKMTWQQVWSASLLHYCGSCTRRRRHSGSHTDSSHGPHFQLPLDLAGLHWKTRQVSRPEMPSCHGLQREVPTLGQPVESMGSGLPWGRGLRQNFLGDGLQHFPDSTSSNPNNASDEGSALATTPQQSPGVAACVLMIHLPRLATEPAQQNCRCKAI